MAHDCRAPRVRSGPRVLCFTLSNADFFDLCGLTQRLPPIPGGGLHCDRPRYRKLQFLFSFLCFCAVSREPPGGVGVEERGAEGWAHPTASRSRPRSAVSTLLWRDVSRLQGTGDSLGVFCRCTSACGSPSPARPAFPGARRPTVLSAAVFNFGSYSPSGIVAAQTAGNCAGHFRERDTKCRARPKSAEHRGHRPRQTALPSTPPLFLSFPLFFPSLGTG